MRLQRYVASVTTTVSLLLLVAVMLTQAKPTVTVATYSPWRYEVLRDDLLPQWRAEYPDIHVELVLHTSTADQLNKVMVSLGSGIAPDIIDTAGTLLYTYVIHGGTIDLAPYIAADLDVDDWFPHLWDEVRYPFNQGVELHAVPYDWVGGVMLYNQDHFDNSGLPYPTDDWMWTDLRIFARRLTRDADGDGINEVWGYGLDFLDHKRFDPLVHAYGGRVLSEDRTRSELASSAAEQALQLYVDMIREDRSTAPPSLRLRFPHNLSGIGVMGSWRVREAENAGINYGVAMVPSGPVTRATYGGADVWAVLKRPGQDLDAVWTITKELVSPRTIGLFTEDFRLPARRSMIEDWVPTSVMIALANSSPYMTGTNWTPDWAQWQELKRKELDPVLEGRMSVREGLERAAHTLDTFLANIFQ